MHLDLSFQDAAAEAAFRRQRLVLQRPHGAVIEWMRMLLGVCFVARLALLQETRGSIAAALLQCAAVVVQLAVCGRSDLRLRYTAASVCEVLLVVGGSIHAPHLGLSGSRPAAARSFAELLAMGGPIWPLFSIVRAPLPFRLLFPVLLSQSAVLVLQASHMCTSPGLQHAYATLHRGLLRAARHTHLLPHSPAAAAAAVESLSCGMCSAYQHGFILLGNALLGYVAFRAELSQRRAFVQRSEVPGTQHRLLASLRQRRQLPVQYTDYWWQFCLPAACALTFLHSARYACQGAPLAV